jgi:putative SOS response-associated peptidase YedK
VPHWADDPAIGNRMINARSETVAEKPAFRASFKRKRCLILADGFYEWQKVEGGAKQPWYYRLKSGDPFAFAGLWAHWEPRDKTPEDKREEPFDSCTILTTAANELVKKVHHRMPVILRPEDHDLWLDREIDDRDRLEAVLGRYDPAEMIAYPVSRRVNSPANDDPSVIEPVGDAKGGKGDEQAELF